MEQRKAVMERKTKETEITLTINLDGTGKTEISTGIPFFDHMLNGFARHGLFDLEVQVKGISRLIPTIRLKIQESCWDRQSQPLWVKKKASGDMEVFFFLWMRHLQCAPWIFPVAHI